MCVRIKASDKMLGIILATNGLAMANSELTVLSAVLVLSYHRVVEMFQYWGGAGSHSTGNHSNNTDGKAPHGIVTLLASRD